MLTVIDKVLLVKKHIQQGLDSYRVPDDLDSLMMIIVNILLI